MKKNLFYTYFTLRLLCVYLMANIADAQTIDSDGDGLLDHMEYGLVETREGFLPTSEVPQPKVECDGNIYQIYSAPSQLAKVDLVSRSFENIGDTSHAQKLNAGGYNSEDGYIYAINRGSPDREVVRIGGDGSVGSIGPIQGLPKYNYVSGSFGPNNLFYVSDYGWLYGINVKTQTVEYAKPLSVNPPGAEIDLAYDRINDVFYVTSGKGSFSKIDHKTGDLKIIGDVGSVFGALVSDSYGNIYGIDNKGTGLYRFNVYDASKTRVSDAPGASQNDAAMCNDIHLFLDTDGDGIDDEYDDDADGDGLDNITDCGGLNPTGDEDGDSIPNWTDASDSGEPGDGSLTNYEDSNMDGIPDAFDSDNDGIANHKDTDSDNDNISDAQEGSTDSDNDSIPDFLDTDSDNDGLSDETESTKDTDGDGVLDYMDSDDDNDGIPTIEDKCPGCNFSDNIIEYDYRDFETLDVWGVYLEQYKQARREWNTLKTELHCFDENMSLEEDKQGFREEEFFLKEDSEVVVTALFDGAQNFNSLSWYDSALAVPELTTIWNAFAFGPLAPLMPGSAKSLGILPAGTKLRFAITSDGANGGEQIVYQEAFRNNKQLELFASKFHTADLESGNLYLAFEDKPNGGDWDFNDVVFKVSIMPRYSVDTGIVSTQYSEVLPGISGLYSDRGRRGVKRQLERLNLNDEKFESSAELFKLPENKVDINFSFLDDRSPMKFSIGLIDWSLLKGLDPQSLAFREVVAKNTVVIMDDRNVNPGDSQSFNPYNFGLQGSTVAFVMVPNNTFKKFASNTFRYTPKGNGNNTKRQCLLSTSIANPGYMDQFMFFKNNDSMLMMIEDKTRFESKFELGDSSNSSFDDIQILVEPALEVVEQTSGYKIADRDITQGFKGPDGNSPQRQGDY